MARATEVLAAFPSRRPRFAQVFEDEAAPAWHDPASMGRLDDLDMTLALGRREQERRLAVGGQRLAQLRLTLAAKHPYGDGVTRLGPPVCLVFEGADASGKGGAIKRLVAPLDPRHVRHASFAAPTPDEKRHHYLQRFVPALPGRGGMTVYDRSWYGRVLVERVEGLATEAQWRRAYGEINAFERALVDDGAIVAKFWLHVSPDEQLRRFERRAADPLRRYKLTEEDWRNRERRADYDAAVEEMVARTDTAAAPWTLVEGDSKRWARVKVMETAIALIERGMARHGLAVPAAPAPPADDD
jgi:polyphosphate kinase 2 (PPK2 family)